MPLGGTKEYLASGVWVEEGFWSKGGKEKTKECANLTATFFVPQQSPTSQQSTGVVAHAQPFLLSDSSSTIELLIGFLCRSSLQRPPPVLDAALILDPYSSLYRSIPKTHARHKGVAACFYWTFRVGSPWTLLLRLSFALKEITVSLPSTPAYRLT